MIRIEAPADRPDILRAFAHALLEIVGSPQPEQEPTPDYVKQCSDHENFQGSVVGSQETDEPPPAATRLDPNNVPFNPTFCGESKDPFNQTGPRKGQWKKKRGVSEEDYDAWYKSELAKVQTQQNDTPVNGADAFSGTKTMHSPDIPKTTDEFFEWVATMTANGKFTQDDVNRVQAANGLTLAHFFGADADTIAPRVEKMYRGLCEVMGA